MDSESKVDRIFEQLPKFLNARADENWSSIIKAIGSEDERLAQLAEEVRKQFFVKTSSRPYLDRLASNNNISRPRFVGMTDTDFRRFIPIMSYQPKQVKRIIDELLDLFFLKDATTAFLSSGLFEPFALKDGWSLEILVDNLNLEHVVFKATDFVDINAITAVEIVAAYNRQARFSYAISFFDSVTKHTFVRIYSNTIGAQGSMLITGGLACITLEPNGFLFDLGLGSNTQWIVTKIGNTVTFTYNAGVPPGAENLRPGDIFFCDLPGNEGSFVITEVDIRLKSFTFENLLGTAGTFTQTTNKQVKWLRPNPVTSFGIARRALAWETTIGEVTVEMPATPPVVARGAKGGFHINGSVSLVTEINSATSLTVADVTNFPESGFFIIEPVSVITARLVSGTSSDVETFTTQGRVISKFTRYSYTGITGNTLTGITPDLPKITTLDETTISSLSKTSGVITCVANNDFSPGDQIFIQGSSGIPILTTTGTTTTGSSVLNAVADTSGVSPGQLISGTGITPGTKVLHVIDPTTVAMTNPATTNGTVAIIFSEDTNGAYEVVTANSTSFTVNQLGTDGAASIPGTASREQLLSASSDFKIIITTSVSSDITKIKGPYIWDLNAPFTLAADTTNTVDPIIAGKTYKLLTVSTNNMPDGPGTVVFDYGQNNQEGPVKYLYKAAENILALDPSYTFQQFHDAGSSVVAVSKLGPHIPSGLGNEYPPYATNPSDARILLQKLIVSVASAGIFIDFIIRFPNQLYGTINVYD